MDQAWWSPGLTHPEGNSAFALWFTGGLFVNNAGQRFVNESAAPPSWSGSARSGLRRSSGAART